MTLPFADERSVVQTRFATTALALLRAALGEDLGRPSPTPSRAVADDLDPALVDAEQFTFLGRGWTVGLAHEAALKMREAAQSWTEAYPAMEYRHGPISIAAPGRVTWYFGEPPAGLADDVAATGARFETGTLDPMAELVRAQRVASPAPGEGLDPDTAPQPHPLGHPRRLTAMTARMPRRRHSDPARRCWPSTSAAPTRSRPSSTAATDGVLGLRRTPTPLDGGDPAGAVVGLRRRARPRACARLRPAAGRRRC